MNPSAVKTRRPNHLATRQTPAFRPWLKTLPDTPSPSNLPRGEAFFLIGYSSVSPSETAELTQAGWSLAEWTTVEYIFRRRTKKKKPDLTATAITYLHVNRSCPQRDQHHSGRPTVKHSATANTDDSATAVVTLRNPRESCRDP